MRDRGLPHRQLKYFELARSEARRTELGGRMRAEYELGHFGIKRIGVGSIALRAAVDDAVREDSADNVVVVALSLALIDRYRPPRMG